LPPLKSFHLPVHIYALAAMIFWGGSFVGTTVLLKYYPPITIILIRLIVSAAILFSFIFLTNTARNVQPGDWKWLFLSAFFNPFLYFLGENFGVMYTSPTISAIIIATIPVFSPLAAWISYREKMSKLNLVGLGISFSGILLMLMNPDFSLAADLKGVIYLFGAVFAALFYSVILKRLAKSYSPIFLVATQNLIGVFLFLPLFFLFESGSLLNAQISAEIIIAFLGLAVFASSLAFVFYARAIRQLGVSKTNVFSNLIPVFTLVFSLILLQEEIGFRKIAGMVLVITGVYLSERIKPGQTI